MQWIAYPFPVDAELQKQMAANMQAAGYSTGSPSEADEEFRVTVRLLSQDRIYWSSPWGRESDFRDLKIKVPSGGGKWAVELQYRWTKKPGYNFFGAIRIPYRLVKTSTIAVILVPLTRKTGPQSIQTSIRKVRGVALGRSTGPRRIRRSYPPVTAAENPVVIQKVWPLQKFYRGTRYSITSPNFTVYSRGYTGTVTPNYRALKRIGKLPVNPYAMDMVSVTDNGAFKQEGDDLQIGAYQSFGGTGPFGSGTLPALGFKTNVDNRAVSKLADASGQSVNNFAQNFAQFGQLTRMVSNTTGRIAGSLNATRKGNFALASRLLWQSKPPVYRKGKKPSKSASLADNWLAFQYGWKPLLQDIQGLMTSIAQYDMDNRNVQTTHVTASADDVEYRSHNLNTTGQAVTGRTVIYTTWSTRIGMRFKVQDPLHAFANQMGFTNPINLAWEVLPFSFVVDWFLPIGPYLENFSSFGGLVFIDGYRSRVTRQIAYWDTYYSGKLYPTEPSDTQMIVVAGNLRRESVKYSREKLTAFPSMTFPTWKNPLSVTHALNGLALMGAAFKGRS